MLLITIGRNPENHYVIQDPTERVSRYHAEIKIRENGSMTLIDESTHGTFINGKRISPQIEYNINRGDEIVFAETVVMDWGRIPEFYMEPDIKKYFGIGTSHENPILIHDPNKKVSRHHAILRIKKDNRMYIYDQSLNGTWVNGNKIKKFKDYEVKRGDRITFAQQSDLDWKQIPKAFPLKKVLIPASAAIAVGLFFLLASTFHCWFFLPVVKCIANKYRNTVVYVYHSYVYKVELGEETFYLTKNDDGDFKEYNIDKPENEPISVGASGFFISTDGKIVTNKHIVSPWAYREEDNKKIKELIDELLAERSGNILDEMKKNDALSNSKNPFLAMIISSLGTNNKDLNIQLRKTLSAQPIISGHSVLLGIAYNDMFLTEESDLEKCIKIKESDKDDIDLAIIQLKSKTLPDKVKNIVDLNLAVVDTKKVENSTELVMGGYPRGTLLGNTKKGLAVTFQDGQVTQKSDNLHIGHNIASTYGSSGSPIFNEKGQLVAINWAGLFESQGFNYGLLARYAVDLAKD